MTRVAALLAASLLAAAAATAGSPVRAGPPVPGAAEAPASRLALEVVPSVVEVSFRVSHPLARYETSLSTGGARVLARFDPANVAATALDVAISVASFDSGGRGRDDHMRRTMDVQRFPDITWEVRGVEGAEGPITPGALAVTATGPLSIRGATRDTAVPVTLVIRVDGTVEATAGFSVSLRAFGIEAPSLLGVAIEDEIPIRVRMVFDLPETPGSDR